MWWDQRTCGPVPYLDDHALRRELSRRSEVGVGGTGGVACRAYGRGVSLAACQPGNRVSISNHMADQMAEMEKGFAINNSLDARDVVGVMKDDIDEQRCETWQRNRSVYMAIDTCKLRPRQACTEWEGGQGMTKEEGRWPRSGASTVSKSGYMNPASAEIHPRS